MMNPLMGTGGYMESIKRVECPACGAPPGRPCMTKSLYVTRAHRSRIRKALSHD